MTEAPDEDQRVIDDVSWAIHAWSCPLCWENGMQAMADSGQDHVTETDRIFASFIVGALGIRRAEGAEPATDPAPPATPRQD